MRGKKERRNEKENGEGAGEYFEVVDEEALERLGRELARGRRLSLFHGGALR